MTYDRQRCGQLVDTAATTNGSTFIRAPLSADVRTVLNNLLSEYIGYDAYSELQQPGDNDLAVLYATARKDTAKGEAVANRIKQKYAHNPLLDPAPAPRPSPVPPSVPIPPKTTGSDTAKLLAEVQRSLETRIADALAETRQLQTNAADTLLKFAEALPGVVQQHVSEALSNARPTILEVIMPEMPPVPLGTVHRKTGDIIKMLAAGVNVYLHGPAGSGKTTVARQCAEAFGTQFYFAAKVESEYLLLGFKDARGETVRTQFREAYEHGGMFLFDELDGSSPSAVVALNASLANGICPFPDAVITRHPEFRCIGAGNTKLSGASRQYTGRTQLDAASIDRFAFLEFGYDEALEQALATDKHWALYVQAARKAVADRGLTHLITPRATIDGCKLLAAGFERETVAEMVMWKGLDSDTVEQITRAIHVPLHSAMRAAA